MTTIIPSTSTSPPVAGVAARVVVLARAPLPGRAKTRLMPAVGALGAARVHAQLLVRTVATVSRVADAPVTLRVAPALGHPLFGQLRRRFGVALRAQCGGDLGRRMHHALAVALRDSDAAVLVGTDCPGLVADDIRTALAALHAGSDAVLGPALDGGYWLIGLRRPAAGLFQGVDWGSAKVAAQTRRRMRRLGLSCHELSPRADLDHPADLWRSGLRPWRGALRTLSP